jgi:hypothetical protein
MKICLNTLLACLAVIFRCIACQNVTSFKYQYQQTNLTRSLMINYVNTVRPSKEVDGSYIVFLRQIVSIDEKNQVMTSSVNIYASWSDPRLSWDPVMYSDISKILLPANQLWLPDLVIQNSADTNIFLGVNSNMYAMITSDGGVNLVYSVSNLRTRCAMNVMKFPFDHQVSEKQLTLSKFETIISRHCASTKTRI